MNCCAELEPVHFDQTRRCCIAVHTTLHCCTTPMHGWFGSCVYNKTCVGTWGWTTLVWNTNKWFVHNMGFSSDKTRSSRFGCWRVWRNQQCPRVRRTVPLWYNSHHMDWLRNKLWTPIVLLWSSSFGLAGKKLILCVALKKTRSPLVESWQTN